MPLIHKGQTPVVHMTWGSNSVPDVAAAAGQFFKGGLDDLAKDDQLIAMLNAADTITDPDKRKAAWREGLQRIAEEAYWVPMFTYAKYYAWTRELEFSPTSDEIPQFFAAHWK
jgi:peptide/nickel transport system substrate-binding protein